MELIGLVIAVAGLLLALIPYFRPLIDARRALRFLGENTEDRPRKSHLSSEDLSQSLGISVDRIEMAGTRNRALLRSKGGEWSIWRAEPQSIYEERGFIELGGR